MILLIIVISFLTSAKSYYTLSSMGPPFDPVEVCLMSVRELSHGHASIKLSGPEVKPRSD
jgi:hypothetical protein